MNYLLYIILFILTFLFVKISCEFRLYYVITKQNFIIKMLLFAAVIVIVIRSYMENNNIEGFDENTGYYNRQGELDDATGDNPFIQDKINILKKEYIYDKYQKYDNFNNTRLKLDDMQNIVKYESGSLNSLKSRTRHNVKIANQHSAKYAEVSFVRTVWGNYKDMRITKSGTGFEPGKTYNIGTYLKFNIPDHVCSDPQHTTREECLKNSGTCVDSNDVDVKKDWDDCMLDNTSGNTWIPSNTWDIEIKSMATPTDSETKEDLVKAQTKFQENPQYNSILGKTNVSNAMQEAFYTEITKQETINPTGPPNDNNKEPPGTTFSEDGKAIFDPESSVNQNIIDKGVEKAREAGLREIIKHNESLKETGANKGLFTGDVGMNFNSAYNDSGELSTVYGGKAQQESGSQENISPINLDTYSKDILETTYPPSCTKTLNQREKICATLDTHNKCNSSTCCAYNSYNGQNMCVAGDRNGPSTIKSLIDYYYYLGKCYPGKKSCPNKPPL